MNPYDAIRWINIVALSLVVLGLLISACIRSVTVLFVALVAVLLIYTPMVECWVTNVRRRKQFRGPDL